MPFTKFNYLNKCNCDFVGKSLNGSYKNVQASKLYEILQGFYYLLTYLSSWLLKKLQ